MAIETDQLESRLIAATPTRHVAKRSIDCGVACGIVYGVLYGVCCGLVV